MSHHDLVTATVTKRVGTDETRFFKRGERVLGCWVPDPTDQHDRIFKVQQGSVAYFIFPTHVKEDTK